MPTYQYACTECGHAFDIVQSFSDDSLTVCPECGGRLRKVFNAVGVVFKGSGFYRTDSRGKQTSDAGSPTKEGASTSGSASESGATSESGKSSSNGASGKPSDSSSTSSSKSSEKAKA